MMKLVSRFSLLFVSIYCSSLWAASADLRFSEFEQSLMHTVLNSERRSPNEVMQQLIAMEAQITERPLSHQALLYFHLCRMAGQLKEPVEVYYQALLQLETHVAAPQKLAARYLCETIREGGLKNAERYAALTQTVYELLSEHDTPAFVMWFTYDYAERLSERGHPEEAIQVIYRSLEIAEANNLTEWQGESLGRLSVIQSTLGLQAEALENNQRALELVTHPYNISNFQLHRGYLLTKVGELAAARQLYEQLVAEAKDRDQETYLVAGLNLMYLYQRLTEYGLAAALADDLLAAADSYGNNYYLAFVKVAHAPNLLQVSDLQGALALFEEASFWLQENNVKAPLPEILQRWSKTLFDAGYAVPAYQALQQSIDIQTELDKVQRQNDAVLANARLATEQTQRALLQSENDKALVSAELERKRLQSQFLFTVLLAIFVVGVILIFFYWQMRKANRQLNYASTHDALTKVHNRRFFDLELVPQLLNGKPFLLVSFDIDHFKKINDSYGHFVGDEVLIATSNRLRNSLRKEDYIIRWGGEEFLMCLRHDNICEQTLNFVERMLNEFSQSTINTSKGPLRVTASLGFKVAQCTSQAELSGFLNDIDQYLYLAKERGRNRAFGQAELQQEVMEVQLS